MTDNELLLAISDMMDKKLKAELQPMKDSIKRMDDNLQDVKQHVNLMELHLETITEKNISILLENYMPAAERYTSETKKIEAM